MAILRPSSDSEASYQDRIERVLYFGSPCCLDRLPLGTLNSVVFLVQVGAHEIDCFGVSFREDVS